MTDPADKAPGGHDFMIPAAAFDRAPGTPQPALNDRCAREGCGRPRSWHPDRHASWDVLHDFEPLATATADYPPLRSVTPPEFPTPWKWGPDGLQDANGNLILASVTGRYATRYVGEVTALAPQLEAMLKSYDSLNTETEARVWWAAKNALLARLDAARKAGRDG